MTNQQVDEGFLDYVVKRFEFDCGLRSLVGTIKPLICAGQEEYEAYNEVDLIEEMREGTEIGDKLYVQLYETYEKEFKDFLGKKPNLDELVLAIDDIYSIDRQRKEADWPSLRLKKDWLLEKCSTIRRVLFTYLEEVPTLRGYLITVDDLENDFKQL